MRVMPNRCISVCSAFHSPAITATSANDTHSPSVIATTNTIGLHVNSLRREPVLRRIAVDERQRERLVEEREQKASR